MHSSDTLVVVSVSVVDVPRHDFVEVDLQVHIEEVVGEESDDGESD